MLKYLLGGMLWLTAVGLFVLLFNDVGGYTGAFGDVSPALSPALVIGGFALFAAAVVGGGVILLQAFVAVARMSSRK